MRTRKQGKTVCFQTSPKTFKRLKPSPENECSPADHRESTVFHFWLILAVRRSLWVGGLAAFFLLICLSSFYVWDISFEGNHRFTDETLLHFHGHSSGAVRDEKEPDLLHENWKNRSGTRFPEISWVSAELTGTRTHDPCAGE